MIWTESEFGHAVLAMSWFAIYWYVSKGIFALNGIWFLTDIDELKSPSSMVVEKSDAHKIEDLQRQLAEKNLLLEHLMAQIEQMKMSYHALIERTDSNNLSSTIGSSSDSAISQTYVGQVPVKEDEGYFNTYAHFDIHHDMLSVSRTQKVVFNRNVLIFF